MIQVSCGPVSALFPLLAAQVASVFCMLLFPYQLKMSKNECKRIPEERCEPEKLENL